MHRAIVASLIALSLTGPALAIDEAHKSRGEEIAAKAIAYLRSAQDKTSGGWSIPEPGKGAPTFPAISGLVLNGMLMQPGVDHNDPTVARGIQFILSSVRSDGGIYDTILPTYNTAICASALARVDTPEAKKAVAAALDHLRRAQWGAPGATDADMKGQSISLTPVDKDHPFYGGLGYGNRSRPDISNLQFMLQAFADCRVPTDDPAFKRALVFLQRCQMIERGSDGMTINDQPYAKGSTQGGFIYATAENAETVGKGQSFAGTIEETLDDGSRVSRLRAYGSTTYAGFKSYIYAGLNKSDPRVHAALDWITSNYTLKENPGIGAEGYYYYVIAFARALDAHGSPVLSVREPAAASGPAAVKQPRDWQNDLVDRLAELQQPDGSFKVMNDRWMENNPVLITSYSLVALQHALRE
ncbi:MAG: prenyltransferase/squalene oxidase repeat-containing protein [Phycisphaerales bacterium]